MKLTLLISLTVLLTAAAWGQPCVDAAKQVKPVISTEAAKTYEANLAIAREAYSKNPQIAEELIWYGRRMAYLGEYKEAIKIFTEGVAKFPKDARMYRHRGHRYITLRCFDDAIRDFETAAKLIKGKPDSVEPDGMPNARNIPTSTLQSNIWYHLGLAYYLKGDFKKAEKAYAECQKVSKNNDMLVATVYWRYMALRRSGKAKEAKQLLNSLPKDLEVIENEDYLKLIKLNRDEERPEKLLSTIQGDANTLGSASLGYGIGNYFLYNGDAEKAGVIFRKIVSGDQWASFGYIAAEVEWRKSPFSRLEILVKIFRRPVSLSIQAMQLPGRETVGRALSISSSAS
ncbi:MAG: tetratricopeptide repeat protein [Pyrinomonadaceae bacterium]